MGCCVRKQQTIHMRRLAFYLFLFMLAVGAGAAIPDDRITIEVNGINYKIPLIHGFGTSYTSQATVVHGSYSGAIVIPSEFTHGDGKYEVIGIESSAFKDCSGLTSITIPSSVTSIGSYVFDGCSNLTSIIVKEGNPVYDSRNGCNAIISKKNNQLIAGCKKTTIPNSVTSLGSSAFSGCSSLTNMTIPNSVTSIGNSAFSGCSSLISITIPNSVTSIGNSAFSGCSSLTSITIPNSVTSIGNSAFWGCSSLTSITIPNSVTTIGSAAFGSCI